MSKQLLPLLKRGGYSLRFRFFDEGRGERFFDTEYAVRRIEKDKFLIVARMDYRGGYARNSAKPAHTIGAALKAGTQVSITPRRWTQTRVTYMEGRIITVTDVTADEDGQVLVTYV